MVATYTPNARLTLQGDNDNPEDWGDVLNEQALALIDELVCGVSTVDITGSSNVTLTTSNGANDQARAATLVLTGTLGANIELIVPSVKKHYYIRGAWTGPYTVSVKIASSGTNVPLETGNRRIVYTDGTNIYDMIEEQGLKVSPNDDVPSNLESKLLVSTPLIAVTTNEGADEKRTISVDSDFLLECVSGVKSQNFRPGSSFDAIFLKKTYISNNGVFMKLGADLTKTLQGPFVVGTGNAGLDTGSRTANTRYYCFIIFNPTTGVTDVLYSLNRTSPTMPSGFTERRLVGFVRTDISSIINEWHTIWDSIGAYNDPKAYLMASLTSGNAIDATYFILTSDLAATGTRHVFKAAGNLEIAGNITAFTGV